MSDPTASTQPAASYEATVSPAGRFVWHDLMTTDREKAIAFYTSLFGWECRPVDMGGSIGTYDMLHAGTEGIGGMVPLDPTHGIPSHWVAYLGVDDVDATCARADATGGKTCVPPMDIPGTGRFAVVEDPTGAIFSPFSSTTQAPPPPANAPRGTFAWNELMTTDPERAGAFYAGLTGWTVEKMDMGPLGFYHLFKRGGEFAGGMMQMPPRTEARPHWLPYFAVASADDAAERIAALEGTVLHGPIDIQQWGRMAVAQDPTGAYFAVLENKQPM
jgi:predicted enzyme related to lactoylglutathione lyase